MVVGWNFSVLGQQRCRIKDSTSGEACEPSPLAVHRIKANRPCWRIGICAAAGRRPPIVAIPFARCFRDARCCSPCRSPSGCFFFVQHALCGNSAVYREAHTHHRIQLALLVIAGSGRFHRGLLALSILVILANVFACTIAIVTWVLII